MGEKIKNLSEFSVDGINVAVELNDGYDKEYSKFDIHIQSKAVQYCLSDVEFMKLASAVTTAKRNLDTMKLGCEKP